MTLTTVVTVMSGRHENLLTQRAFLARIPSARHIVVAIDDLAAPELLAREASLPTVLVDLPTHPAGLPVAAARNAGAARALADGADALLFLDVDCIPDQNLLTRVTRSTQRRPDALVCGTVTYLPPRPPGGWTRASLAVARRPHPARPDPAPGELVDLPPELFWSLCFATSRALWIALGGFYEGYLGYGGEDTDFAVSAAAAGAPTVMAGGADAFHQHHVVSDPPRQHLDDIVRNSAVFGRRHGRLPMTGWLSAFERDGLIAGDPPRRVDAVRLATVPARHAYLDATVPGSVARVALDRVAGWDPDPLLETSRLDELAGDLDVIHVHFGYDHVTPSDMDRWLRAVRARGTGLVVTVHDLRNPHQPQPQRHDAHLRSLVRAADRVITLTDAAADECWERYGRRPEVIAHPTLLAEVPAPTSATTRAVLVPLKSLRRNVLAPLRIVTAAARGAMRAGARVSVLVEPGVVDRPELAGLRELRTTLPVDLDIAPYLPHDELCARVAAARAVVLPYRFGTHSGWVELARDLGTRVVAPDCGHYRSQWSEVMSYVNNECVGLDEDSLAHAVQDACSRPAPSPAERVARLAERDQAQAAHERIYRDVTGK